MITLDLDLKVLTRLGDMPFEALLDIAVGNVLKRLAADLGGDVRGIDDPDGDGGQVLELGEAAELDPAVDALVPLCRGPGIAAFVSGRAWTHDTLLWRPSAAEGKILVRRVTSGEIAALAKARSLEVWPAEIPQAAADSRYRRDLVWDLARAEIGLAPGPAITPRLAGLDFGHEMAKIVSQYMNGKLHPRKLRRTTLDPDVLNLYQDLTAALGGPNASVRSPEDRRRVPRQRPAPRRGDGPGV